MASNHDAISRNTHSKFKLDKGSQLGADNEACAPHVQEFGNEQ